MLGGILKGYKLQILLAPIVSLKNEPLGVENGSAIRSTDCFSRGPVFDFQHSHSGSQPSEPPIPGDPTLLTPRNTRHTLDAHT